MKYTITVYPNVKEPGKGYQYETTFKQLEVFLTKKRQKVQKENMVAWTPAAFDGPRSAKNCKYVSLMVFDVDRTKREVHAENGLDCTFDVMHGILKELDLQHIMHSSYSSTKETNKFRIIFPLGEPVQADLWTDVYKAGIEKISEIIEIDVDSSTCDSSRAYFTSYESKHFQYASHYGKNIVDWQQYGLERREQQALEQRKRREENERRVQMRKAQMLRDGKHASYTDWKKYQYELLKFDYVSRHTLATKLGATISGNRAHNWICPACNRKDATFFYIEPYLSNALYCGHVKTCGDKTRPRRFTAGYVAEFWGLL